MNNTLHELTGDRLTLYELLTENEGEVTPETESIIEEFFNESDEAIAQRLEGYGHVIAEFLDRARIISAEIERLQKKLCAPVNSANYLKRRIFNHLALVGTKKIETSTFTFRLQKNSGKTPVTVNDYFYRNPSELPEKYCRVEFKPNLEAIRCDLEALELGDEEFEEVRSIAALGERGTHLRID